MAHKFQTISVCPECAAEIPATVTFGDDDMVWMDKRCVLHENGEYRALLEKDQQLYALLRQNSCAIYPGHFIDVTTRCNLACSYCYYPCRESIDPTVDQIVQEALVHPVPTFLTGGEPTLREDLPAIMARLQSHYGTAIPTNGIGLLNVDYFKDVLKHIGRYGENVARIALSWHAGLNEKAFRRVMENVREFGERISGPIFVLKDVAELPQFIAIAKEYQDCIEFARVHLATDIWDAKDYRRLFLSDVLKAMGALAQQNGVEFAWHADRASAYWIPTTYDGVAITFAKWMTRYDFDLCHIPRQPSYTAHNGETVQLIHGMIINEAMQRGWCKGRRIETLQTKVVAHG